MDGYIRLYRHIQDNDIWDDEPYDKSHAFIDLLLSAEFTDRDVLIGRIEERIPRGSLATSESKLMKRWRWSKTKLRSFLHELEEKEMIIRDANRMRTIITIVNYEKYQADLDHSKKNNAKNTNKKEGASKFAPPTMEELQQYCAEISTQKNVKAFAKYYADRNWRLSTGKRMTDWRLALRSWHDGTKGKSPP